MVQNHWTEEMKMQNETIGKTNEEHEKSGQAGASELDHSYNPTPFKYKALAALILIVPFGFLIDGGQNFFLKMDWEYISKMTVLIGLILYIVAVGKLASKFKEWDDNRKRS